MGRLQDKFALITGAGAGLGLAMSKLFASEGAFVFMCDRDEDMAKAGATTIAEAGGRALALRADVTEQDDINAMTGAILAVTDKLHVLVNNAGNLPRADFRHMEDADWENVLNPHLWGTIRVTRAVLPLMQAAKGASIVNLSSIMAQRYLRQLSGYSTAKAAITGLSQALAVEFAPYEIRVNYLCPGFIPTGMTNRYTNVPQFAKMLLAQTPMRRFGTPEDVAKAALFFASDDSLYTTGQGLMVDGGMSLNLA